MTSDEEIQRTQPAAKHEFTLVPAAVDFNTFKTQMVVAAIVGIVATVAVDFRFAQAHLIRLGILALCAILVGQITSQITDNWGNRLGAAPAIWASLLYALNPLNMDLLWVRSAPPPAVFLDLFMLSGAFFTLRWFALRERSYVIFSILSACGFFAMALRAGVNGWLSLVCAPLAIFVACALLPCSFVGNKGFAKMNVWLAAPLLIAACVALLYLELPWIGSGSGGL